jgi:large subunit ribosomal protein L21
MFAVVETGGKQYVVAPSQKIIVEKLEGEVGSKILLDKVLLIQDKNGVAKIGSPVIEGAKVEAEICKTAKDKKVLIFKKRRRKNSRRKNGHRQTRTLLKIISIN